MTSFRDSISTDFQDVCDDLETVRLFSRATGQLVAPCPNAKRSLDRDAREAFDSLGFAVSDFIKFQIATADLGLTYQVQLGDWLLDAAKKRYVVAGVFDSRMTSRLRLSCVSLEEVLGSLVSITERGPDTESGAPSARNLVRHANVPARVWAVDQAGADYLGEDLRPRYRAAFFADGTQVRLPLPQGCGLIGPDGEEYDVTAVKQLDQLVGFAIADMSQNPRSAT